MTVDCIVVGAGPAGLSASAALTEQAVEHVVLERGRVGQSWRRQRWDSFRLNTPGRMNAMLRPEALDEYLVGTDVVGRLEKLAADAPVHEGVAVRGLVRTDDGFSLRTDGGDLMARTVVIASGDQNVPVRPALAAAFPDAVAQYHTADYRKADDLPSGAVLVVGSAQSGCQIAEDLLRAGRRVVLSTSPVGRLPWRHRGRDTVDWLLEIAFFDQRPQDLPDPSVMRAAQPIVASGGRSLGLQAMARAGATLVGRPTAVDGQLVTFDDSVRSNLAAGDAFATKIRTMLDEFITRTGADAPPFQPEETDEPVTLHPPAALDMRAEDIGSVVWCSGFTGDFSWLSPDLVGVDRMPRRREAAATVPGLWYVGLKWLTRRGSGIFHGFPGDASSVADAVRAHLRG